MDTTFSTPEETKPTTYAGFWLRFLAYLLDSILVGFACAIVFVVFMLMGIIDMSQLSSDDPSAGMNGFFKLFILTVVLMTWIYFAVMESSRYQATPGKMTLNIIVTDLDGNRITFLRASGRFFAKILSNMTIYIGYILAAFTQKKQALHDMIAGTLVVKNEYTNP